MADDVGPLADPRIAAKQAKAAKRAQREEIDEVRALMASRPGRAFIWRLLTQVCHVHATSFTGNSATFFNEGARGVGLYYLGLLKLHCFDAYQLMEKEARENEEVGDAR